MGIKPTIEIMPQQALTLPPRHNAVSVATPPQMVTVPAPLQTPITTWGARRQARYYRALTEMTDAQSGYLRSRAELSEAFITAARAAHKVAELPEICADDSEVRRLQRERDYLNARREVEEARYGFYATQNEVDRLRSPRLKKISRHSSQAIDALMKTKVDMEALGEDTSEIEQTLAWLQQVEP